ncbi:MAG: ABC transporter ATP-binding protein [Oscillospiraceae bacterium]
MDSSRAAAAPGKKAKLFAYQNSRAEESPLVAERAEIIYASDIVKTYKMGEEQLEILHGISLTVERGEFIAILGPSGSGKSTLMNILGCMDRATSGSYVLNGIEIGKRNDAELTGIRNKEIGFIFQKYHLVPRYTVLQNIIIPLLARGLSQQQATKQVEGIVSALGLNDRTGHKPNELSGGQQQRVAIARALATQPAVLLADEPTGALDKATGIEVLQLFKELNRQGNTILMITHDLQVAENAQRIVRIEDGRLYA